VGIYWLDPPLYFKDMENERIPVKDHRCQCGKSLNTVREIGTAQRAMPKEGDVAICAYCGTITIFDKDNDPIVATEEMLLLLKKIDERQYNNMIAYSNTIKDAYKG
jgi:hypothetical protein